MQRKFQTYTAGSSSANGTTLLASTNECLCPLTRQVGPAKLPSALVISPFSSPTFLNQSAIEEMMITRAVAVVATVAMKLKFTHGYSFSNIDPSDDADTEMTPDEESRIFGGEAANIDNYPFLAGLRDSVLDQTFCSGTLVAPQYILTAGHCIKTDEMKIVATFGANDSTGSDSGAAMKYPIIEGFRHPRYMKKQHLYDVGLLKLRDPVEIEPAEICPIDGSSNKVGTRATVLGWGKTEDGTGNVSPVLEELTLPIISNEACESFTKYDERITHGMLCAGVGGGRDTCNGDSGGPLLVNRTILVGCVSWGSKCGQQAGVFTRLTYVMDYINDILKGGNGSSFNWTSDEQMEDEYPPSDGSSDDAECVSGRCESNERSADLWKVPTTPTADLPELAEAPAPSDQSVQQSDLPRQSDSSPQQSDFSPQQSDSLPQQSDSLPQQSDSSPFQGDLSEPSTPDGGLPIFQMLAEAPAPWDQSVQQSDLPRQSDSSPQQSDFSPQQSDSLPQQSDSLPQQSDSLPQQSDSPPFQGDLSEPSTPDGGLPIFQMLAEAPAPWDQSVQQSDLPRQSDSSPQQSDFSPHQSDSSPHQSDFSPRQSDSSPSESDNSPFQGDFSVL